MILKPLTKDKLNSNRQIQENSSYILFFREYKWGKKILRCKDLNNRNLKLENQNNLRRL